MSTSTPPARDPLHWVRRMESGDPVGLARLITQVERRGADLAPIMAEIHRGRKGAPCLKQEMGKRVPVRTKAKLRAAANEPRRKCLA